MAPARRLRRARGAELVEAAGLPLLKRSSVQESTVSKWARARNRAAFCLCPLCYNTSDSEICTMLADSDIWAMQASVQRSKLPPLSSMAASGTAVGDGEAARQPSSTSAGSSPGSSSIPASPGVIHLQIIDLLSL